MTPEPVVVVGIGHDGPSGLTPEALDHIAQAQVLAGGKRQLDFFPAWQGEKIVIDADLAGLVRRLRACYAQRKTVVLASGDPLYYGIGKVLLETLPRSDLVFLPHVSSVQLAFARIKQTWNDARVISLHGRPLSSLLPALQDRAAKIAILTDATNHPAAIADFLRDNGAGPEYAVWVCENLGGPDERITSRWPVKDLQGESFAPLNVVILIRAEPAAVVSPDQVPLLGIPENALSYRSGERGLITKWEFRLIALGYLEVRPGNVVWDVGAGSGSVSLEAARLSPQLRVFTVEKEPKSLVHLKDNLANFGLANIRLVEGEAPEALADLPDPDAVFIGGSGGRLRDIIGTAARRLRPGGRVVINCITLENFARGWDGLKEAGLCPRATSVQLAHSRPLGGLHCLEPENLIFILWAKK